MSPGKLTSLPSCLRRFTMAKPMMPAVQPGWDAAAFDDSRWEPAREVHPPEPEIVSQYFQPIREEKVLTAKAITNPKPGVFIFDFGQNLSGVPRLRVRVAAGTDIQLRF